MSLTNGGTAPAGATGPNASNVPQQIDNLISLYLHLWPALTIAIEHAAEIPSVTVGEEKRAWFAGALSDLFSKNQIRDIEDLEDIIEQVMNDEFEAVVDDGSLEEIARKIWTGRAKIIHGDSSEVAKLMSIWEERQKKQTKVRVVKGPEVNQDTDGEEEEEMWNGFSDSRNEDVDMDEAPALVDVSQPKKKPEPEVDEDGFTKVVGKKKR